ncbi:MAG: hypothetical protein AB8G16_19445 [Gammaproteobacteria bacterium]
MRILRALGVLPILFTLGSLFVSLPLSLYFAGLLGIPPDSPVKDHENGWLWMYSMFVILAMGMVLGYLLGWIANAVISVVVFGWSTDKVVAVYNRLELPANWLEDSKGP